VFKAGEKNGVRLLQLRYEKEKEAIVLLNNSFSLFFL